MKIHPDQRDYDEARALYTPAVQRILLDPNLERVATLYALIDCAACVCGGAVNGGFPKHEILARFKQSLAEAIQVASEKDGAH